MFLLGILNKLCKELDLFTFKRTFNEVIWDKESWQMVKLGVIIVEKKHNEFDICLVEPYPQLLRMLHSGFSMSV